MKAANKEDRELAKYEMFLELSETEQRRAIPTVLSIFMDGHCLTLEQLFEMINEGRPSDQRFVLPHLRVALLELAELGSIRTAEIGGQTYYRGPRSKEIPRLSKP